MCCALAVDNPQKKENPADRESLGLNGEAMNKKSGSSGMHDPTSVAGQLDAERDTQDDMLGELSTVISQMKEMSMDMNVEIQRQSPGIDHLSEDIQELNSRVKRANVRGQRLLRR
jgi:synaptosomal-associated protein 25